jgi:hypothetical protein
MTPLFISIHRGASRRHFIWPEFPENAALLCNLLPFLADILSCRHLFSITSRDRPSFFIFGDLSSLQKDDFLADFDTHGKERQPSRRKGIHFHPIHTGLSAPHYTYIASLCQETNCLCLWIAAREMLQTLPSGPTPATSILYAWVIFRPGYRPPALAAQEAVSFCRKRRAARFGLNRGRCNTRA